MSLKINVDEKELIMLYLDKQMSVEDLAKHYKCSITPIRRRLKRNNILLRDRSECKMGDKNPMFDKKGNLNSRFGKKSKIFEIINKSRKGKKLEEIYSKEKALQIKQKMSEKRKGENCYWYGKHRSEETKQKLRMAKKGK